MMDPQQIIPQKVCLECSGCCRFEAERSAWAVHLSGREQQELGIQDTVLPAKKDRPDGQLFCNFYDTSRRQCAIYYKRPFECRLYPFVINRKGSEIYLALDLNCPFARDNYQTAAMRDFIAGLCVRLSSAEFLDFIKTNPWLAQEYPGVLNIAVISK